MLTESGETLGEVAEKGPELENDLDEENSDNDSSNDDGDDEKNSHEGVGLRDTESVNKGSDTLDLLLDSGDRVVRVAAGGSVDASLNLSQDEGVECLDGTLGLEKGAATVDSGAIGENESAILEDLNAVLAQVTAGRTAEVVNGDLHVGPGNDAARETKVLDEAAVDGRVADGKHAVHGHALEPSEYLGETRADGTSTSGAAATEGGAASSESRADRRHAGSDKSETGNTGGNVRNSSDAGSLTVGDLGRDAGDLFVGVEGLELKLGLSGNIGDCEGDIRDHAGILIRNFLSATGREAAGGN